MSKIAHVRDGAVVDEGPPMALSSVSNEIRRSVLLVLHDSSRPWTGTATQVCCESTARDAMMLNYKAFFIADGNATFNDL